MKIYTKLARDLSVGDYLVTAIGYAPITKLTPERGMLLAHLGISDERSTRPDSETSVLTLYPGQQVRFRPQTEPPSPNSKRLDAREDGVLADRLSKWRRSGRRS